MELIVKASTLHGEITIPGSKSHTIRALVMATLAEGISTICHPLVSADTRSCLQGCTAFGASAGRAAFAPHRSQDLPARTPPDLSLLLQSRKPRRLQFLLRLRALRQGRLWNAGSAAKSLSAEYRMAAEHARLWAASGLGTEALRLTPALHRFAAKNCLKSSKALVSPMPPITSGA